MAQPAPPPGPTPPRRLPRWLRDPVLLAALALFAGAAAAAEWPAPWWAVLAPALAGLALLCLFLRKRRVQLVGPLFYFDLIRLARRGRTTLLRCGYALALLAGLWMVYTGWSGRDGDLDFNDLARLGQKFVEVLLILQSAAVFVLTPPYLAGTIVEERESKTLDLLLTTHLHDREIILGKLLSRLAHLAGVLLTGLPVLCLMQFWGGIDTGELLATFAVTGLSLLSVGSLSIFFSVTQRSRLAAVILSYFLMAMFFGCCAPFPWGHVTLPFVFLGELDRRLGLGLSFPWFGISTSPASPSAIILQMVCEYALVHGLIALLFLLGAVCWLRQDDELLDTASRLLAERKPRQIVVTPHVPMITPHAELRLAVPARPPVGEAPLLWKELHDGHDTLGLGVMYLCIVGVCGFAAPTLTIALLILATASAPLEKDSHNKFIREVANPCLRWVCLTAGMTACLSAGIRAAGSISHEREQQTLDSLLTLPVERKDILSAKWLGTILRMRALGYTLAAVFAAALVSGTLHPLAIGLLTLSLGSYVAFVASVGLWLSVLCRSTMRANTFLAGLLLLLFLGPWLALAYGPAFFPTLPWGPREKALATFLEVGCNPLGSWWYSAFSWKEFVDRGGWAGDWAGDWPVPGLIHSLSGTFFFAAAAWAFWRLACRRFRQIT